MPYVADLLHMGDPTILQTLIFSYISIHTSICRYDISAAPISHSLLFHLNTDLNVELLIFLQVPFPHKV
jgi:hypothetical protein